jgi:hypothetical protein
VGPTYDNATSAYFGTGSTTHTQSHTTAGSNRVLAVFCRTYDGAGVSGVTYNGVSLTQSGTEQTFGSDRFSKWFLVNPASGANNVVVTCSTSRRLDLDIVSLTGALQSGQPDAANSATGSSASASQSVTTVADNSMLVAAYFSNGAGDPSSGHTNWTQRALTTGRHAVGTSGILTPAGSKTQTIALASSGSWAISQMSFSPSPGSSFSVSDTVTPVETVTALRTRLFSLSDTATISETITAALGRIFSAIDTATVTDTATALRARIFSALDTLAVTEPVATVRLLWNQVAKVVSSWSSGSPNSSTWNNDNRL